MSADRWSVTRMRAWHRCHRLYHYRYCLDLGEPQTDAQAFGSVGHEVLEHCLRSDKGEELPELRSKLTDAYELARLQASLYGYRTRWSHVRWEVLGVEVPFEFELAGHVINGRMDGIVRDLDDGRVFVLEHKFTSSDTSPGSSYWERLAVDTQIGVYIDGAAVLGHDVAGVIYDVIVKPSHKVKRATPLADRKYTKGSAKELPRLYAGQRETDETPDEFYDRICEDIAARPADYYQRAIIVRTGDELSQLRNDILQTIHLARVAEMFDVAPRNPDACFQYGSRCFFWDACLGAADIADTLRFPRRTRTESTAQLP